MAIYQSLKILYCTLSYIPPHKLFHSIAPFHVNSTHPLLRKISLLFLTNHPLHTCRYCLSFRLSIVTCTYTLHYTQRHQCRLFLFTGATVFYIRLFCCTYQISSSNGPQCISHSLLLSITHVLKCLGFVEQSHIFDI